MALEKSIVGNIVFVAATGRLDFDRAAGFQEDLEMIIRAPEPAVNTLVIDCSELGYISSAGLRAFLVAARAAKEFDIEMRVCGLGPPILQVFSVSGFDRIIGVVADRATAIEQYGNQ